MIKKTIFYTLLSIPVLTNAQIAKGDWVIEGAISPIIIPKNIYTKHAGITPLKISYAPNDKMLVGLNTNIFREGIGYFRNNIVDVSPNFQYIFFNQKRFMAFGEASGGYSQFRNTILLTNVFGMSDPLLSNNKTRKANGFNASLGVGFRYFVLKNIGIQTTLSYINRRATFTENNFSRTAEYRLKANYLTLNTGIFFRLHKTK